MRSRLLKTLRSSIFRYVFILFLFLGLFARLVRDYSHYPRVSELVRGISRSISGANSGLVRYLLKTDEAVQIAENLLEVQYIDLAVSQEGAFAENR